ncbi:MAG: uracil-DNA glycosylase [Candidatus Hydrogenedentes bacterium]|nr:uracil-DNA glycosylase [Candidatus Hydrogenedentota bacterium]
MNPVELYKSALEDTQALVRQLSQRPRKTATLSPEVAALLESLSTAAVDSTEAQADAPSVASAPPPNEAPSLAELAEAVRACKQCSLCETRTQTVFGVGNENADLVFVGEAPGADEDAQGEPFVGKAGQLLTDIIVKGMKVRREEVYICNVLKCRPPNNRNPKPEEMAQCEPFLVQQLARIRPKVICALGGVAAKCLLQTEEGVGRLRGRWHNYQGIPLRVTYHPAYLLRTPSDKGKVWEDIQEVMKVLSGEVIPEV